MKNLPLAGLAFLTSCGLFAGTEEPMQIDQVNVVAKDAAFDPRQAVDDKDEAGRGPLAGKLSEDRASPPEPKPLPANGDADGEHITTPAEVDSIKQQRRNRLEQAEKESRDSTAKEQIAHNPPAEPLGGGKSVAWTWIEYALEGLLVGIVALCISGLVTLWRLFPRAAGWSVFGAVSLLAVWLFSQVG